MTPNPLGYHTDCLDLLLSPIQRCSDNVALHFRAWRCDVVIRLVELIRTFSGTDVHFVVALICTCSRTVKHFGALGLQQIYSVSKSKFSLSPVVGAPVVPLYVACMPSQLNGQSQRAVKYYGGTCFDQQGIWRPRAAASPPAMQWPSDQH